MASQADAVAGASAPSNNTTSHTEPAQTISTEQPVEMSDLPASPRTANEEFKDAVQQQEPAPTTDAAPSSSEPPTLTRKETEALGPATDAPITAAATSAGPALSISLMLTTGARHPYKIDEKYLKNRKVDAKNAEGQFEPQEISGYQLKELIWTDWRNEWEPRPASPSSIRLIFMGRMIEDKMALKGETGYFTERRLMLTCTSCRLALQE